MSELPRVVWPPPGPRSREVGARLAAVESPAFEARRSSRAEASGDDFAPVVYERASGSNVFDVDGNRYVDLVAGFGALVLGHRPEVVLRAVAEQAAKLPLALGDVYGCEVKAALGERVAALYPERGARVLFGLSGADAVTAALKTAVLATGRPGVVAFEGGYHGLSYAPLAVCGLSPAFRAPFAAQLGDHVHFAPYPVDDTDLDRSLSAVRAALTSGTVGAVLVEPLQGRGGCRAPARGFVRELASLCRAHGALLVADEIWTGLGRSGAWLASRDEAIADVICLGKGLGGGEPISACVGRADVMAAWGAHGGTAIHTATHFGAPTACAAALATLDAIEARALPDRAARIGDRLRDALSQLAPDLEVTGRALLVGLVLPDARAALHLTRRMLQRGYLVLTGGPRGDVITLSPPLTLEEPLVDAFAEAFVDEWRAARSGR